MDNHTIANISLDSLIEAILFFKSEPISTKELASYTESSESETRDALVALDGRLRHGIRLMENDGAYQLATAADTASIIEKIRKDELVKDLGKAGAETLAIILYKSPITRSELEYVRGVNSTFILRNLLIRGLIERIPNSKDQRSFLYKPTFELMSFLGIQKLEELPEFEAFQKELVTFQAHEDESD